MGADPRLQIRQPFTTGGGEDDGHLAYGEHGRDEPQAEADRMQASGSSLDGCRSEGLRGSPPVLHVRHAWSASRPFAPFRTLRAPDLSE
ncbi:hypothetical protein GCM10010276_84630 [Streptomyces longisporus]|uniref:Uncharacterized protein n=1 Tax=Streptomyces longisporus TaxID=1948 RepID=A0ABN3NHH8_STRLO